MYHPKCILCRCEDVTVDEFREAFQEGFSEFESLKRYTGVGTGICQGKGCLGEAALELARLRGVEPTAIPPITIRQPCEPLTFGQLADLPIPEIDPEPAAGGDLAGPEIPDSGPDGHDAPPELKP